MRYLLVCGLLATAVTACSSSAPNAAAPVITAVRATSGPNRIHALNEAAHRHRGESASLAGLLADPDPQVRWGAAYIAALWADDAADVAALAPLLNDPDAATRAVLAGSLAGLGHSGAREALGALSGSTAPMPFSDPPLTVGRYASDALAATLSAGAPR